jgi:hypothetical protein
VDLSLVPNLQVQEVRLQRLRTRQPRTPGRAAQHLAEVLVGVRWLHVPRRSAEPGPDLLEVDHVGAGRPVRQPGCRSREHEPGQRVGLERRDLIRARRGTRVPQVPHHCQRQPEPPIFA